MDKTKIEWPEGWASPLMGSQRKFHYYRDGKALCGKWRIFPEHVSQLTFTIPKDPFNIMFTSGQDCTACTRKMRADIEAKERQMKEGWPS